MASQGETKLLVTQKEHKTELHSLKAEGHSEGDVAGPRKVTSRTDAGPQKAKAVGHESRSEYNISGNVVGAGMVGLVEGGSNTVTNSSLSHSRKNEVGPTKQQPGLAGGRETGSVYNTGPQIVGAGIVGVVNTIEDTSSDDDIHQQIGPDAEKLSSRQIHQPPILHELPPPFPKEVCSTIPDLDEDTSSDDDIHQKVGSDAEKLSSGQAVPWPDRYQEIGSRGTKSDHITLPIDVEERSSNETYQRKPETTLHERVYLLKAALVGDWPTAASVLKKYPNAVRTPITKARETALHIAVAGKHTKFAKELMKLMKPKDLVLKEEHGQTAFFYVAGSGNVECAEEMVKMNGELPCIFAGEDELPIHIAIQMRQREMVLYLLPLTPYERLNDVQRRKVLIYPIILDMYDVALKILAKYPKLTTLDDVCMSALGRLARKPQAVGRTRELSCWKRYLNLWFKRAYEKDLRKTLSYQLVEDLWKHIQNLPEEQFLNLIEEKLKIFHAAAKLGNIEFLTIILRSYPDLIWMVDKEKERNLLQVAILNRQECIFSLMYEIGNHKDFTVTHSDAMENNMLHLAGQLAPPDRLNIISGAALQMQRELLWFEEIEKIVPPICASNKNSESQKPHEIFTNKHKGLRKDGEKWMRNTANNCMIVATLIATVVFAATFTVPGGNNQDSGTPIFLESNWFLVFFTSTAIALLSSSTSILMFLSILTSRYKQEDFRKSLPRRLMFGLTTLFISIVGMILAFSATCFLVYQSKMGWIPVVIIALASLPIILFLRLHYDLWFDIIRTTYWSKFLFRGRKHGLFQKMEDDIHIKEPIGKEGQRRDCANQGFE